MIQKSDLVFLADGLARRGEERSDQQRDGVRANPTNRMGELPEGQADMTGLAMGQHCTGQGLPPVFQLKPNEGVDAAAGQGLGQKRLHAGGSQGPGPAAPKAATGPDTRSEHGALGL